MATTRQKQAGLRKVCGCARAKWSTCSHSYQLAFRYRKGKHWRLALDKIAGTHLDFAGARALADEIRTKIRLGTFDPNPAPPAPAAPATTPEALTFSELAALWMTREREGQIKDWVSDRGRLRKLSDVALEDGTLGGRAIGRITADDLQVAFRAVSAGIARQTVNKYLQAVLLLQRWAFKKGYLTRLWFDPTDKEARPAKRAKVNRRSRRLVHDVLDAAGNVVEPGEERRLLAVANPWLQRLIIAAIETGCRRGELLALQWAHVDLPRGRLNLPASITKTAEGRAIVISARLRAVLDMVRVNALTGQPHAGTGYVFGNAAGEKVASPKKAWEVAVLKAHGYKPTWAKGTNKLGAESRDALRRIDLHWHDLRHEAGSRWIEAGWPLHHVQRMLGHQDLKQTSTYLNATVTGIEESMRRYDERRGLLQYVAQPAGVDPRPQRNAGAADAANVLIN